KEYVKNALQVVSRFGSIFYPAAASMLNEAFNGEGKDKDFGEDAIVNKILKNDNYFIETLANEFDPALVGQDGGYDNNGKTIRECVRILDNLLRWKERKKAQKSEAELWENTERNTMRILRRMRSSYRMQAQNR